MTKFVIHKEAKKARATKLLNQYDAMRKQMRKLEQELHNAVREYASADGYYTGMTKDTFRIHIQAEEERRKRDAA